MRSGCSCLCAVFTARCTRSPSVVVWGRFGRGQKKDLIRRKNHFQSPSQLPNETNIDHWRRRRTVCCIVRQNARRYIDIWYCFSLSQFSSYCYHTLRPAQRSDVMHIYLSASNPQPWHGGVAPSQLLVIAQVIYTAYTANDVNEIMSWKKGCLNKGGPLVLKTLIIGDNQCFPVQDTTLPLSHGNHINSDSHDQRIRLADSYMPYPEFAMAWYLIMLWYLWYIEIW
jgi:hypothetical protein